VTVLVDTSVWSLVLRRKTAVGHEDLRSRLASLIEDGRVAMIGPVRQELLSGIKDHSQFIRLRDHLRAFPDTEITAEDYEEAAAYFNRCRDEGIQGSNTDFLICAVASRRGFSIFTTDLDFQHFAKLLPIVLDRAG
jgi:predicted nucleic acid-binding protein